MADRNHSDIAVGAIVALFGIAVAGYAASNYALGTMRRMGPGMFPMGLGIAIGLLGLALAASAWLRAADEGRLPEIQWRPAILVVISVIAFSLLIQSFGMIPAVVAVAGISAFADIRANLTNVTLLCLVLCVMAWLIFRLGLGLNFKLMNWPL